MTPKSKPGKRTKKKDPSVKLIAQAALPTRFGRFTIYGFKGRGSQDEAIALVNRSAFGNTTSIFTADGKSAREYASRIEVGMVGVNVGVAAPMAFFPFSGWKSSFYGDLHAHGRDAVAFYTEQKVIMSRWF